MGVVATELGFRSEARSEQLKAGPASPGEPSPDSTTLPGKTEPVSAPRLDDLEELRSRHLLIPVQGAIAAGLHDSFDAPRGTATHGAMDILAARGTPVVAVDDGRIVRLFLSKPGGITIYQFDDSERFTYYYAHLDRYRGGLAEGDHVARGETIGFVGSTGNASPTAPHLHFAIFVLGPEKAWWRGTPVNPFLVLN
jgi:murein DD-endopeptidase MepM/ murein hydrolase activator NlpD